MDFIAMAYFNIDNLDHDPKLAQALGNMLVAWAFGEYTLVSTLAAVFDIDTNMAWVAYYRVPTFEARVKMIRAAITEWKPAPRYDKEAIDNAIEKLSKLSMTRNGWVHGDWCADGKRTATVIFDARKAAEADGRRKDMKVADVITHCGAVRLRANALLDLLRPLP
ncbi:MAG TPA: hypothetical protein VHC73_07390 [Vitreimonas sp.]|nr:hypothetical protein [Vitreimonas sp.]